jgi:hypothetical protein
MTDHSNPHRSLYPSEQDEAIARQRYEDGLDSPDTSGRMLTQGECADLLAYHVGRAHEVFAEQERTIANLEKQNRKLNDRLNRYRNVMPGRKRLITLGRIAAIMEYEADQIMQTSPGDGSGDQPTYQDYQALVEDALFLRRLEWDFEQLIDVVWEPKQDRHVWPRP